LHYNYNIFLIYTLTSQLQPHKTAKFAELYAANSRDKNVCNQVARLYLLEWGSYGTETNLKSGPFTGAGLWATVENI